MVEIKRSRWTRLDLCATGRQQQFAESDSFALQHPGRRSPVLVILPAYNEEANIGQVVYGLKRAADFADILVINDGSDDATAEVAQRSGAGVLNLPYNLGIGGAVQAGIKFAYDYDYPFLVRVDGDGQHDPADVPRLLEVVMQDKADVAIGSRFCKGQVTYHPPLARLLGIRYFSLLVSALVGYRITDPTSGFQCMDRRAIGYLAKNYPQDYPEVEAHVLMKKADLRVVELPVVMRPRRRGSSSITHLRSIYYVFKVTLATIIAFLRDRPRSFRTSKPGEVAHQELPYVTTIQGSGYLG